MYSFLGGLTLKRSLYSYTQNSNPDGQSPLRKKYIWKRCYATFYCRRYNILKEKNLEPWKHFSQKLLKMGPTFFSVLPTGTKPAQISISVPLKLLTAWLTAWAREIDIPWWVLSDLILFGNSFIAFLNNFCNKQEFSTLAESTAVPL